MDLKVNSIEARLWEAADELRPNSKLKSSEYLVPALGLVFLRYAYSRLAQVAAGPGRGPGHYRLASGR